MKIFVIPSWFPNRQNGIAGIFIQQQLLAFARTFADDRLAVSLHATGDFFLHTRRPLSWLPTAWHCWRAKPQQYTLAPNCTVYSDPALEWHPALCNGNLAALIERHARNLERFIAEHGTPDLLHAHVSWPAGWITMQLARRYAIPYVITEHMGPFPFRLRSFIRNGQLTKRIAWPLAHADAVIGVSPFLCREIERLSGVAAHFIPNPVDAQRFQPAPDPANPEFHFFALGQLRREKGVWELLEACNLLRQRKLPFRLTLGGHGPERARLQQHIVQKGLQNTVAMPGAIPYDEVADWIHLCDAFVLPSHLETFSVVCAEAIACGKPVVATRCGGPEVIVTADNGLLVPVRDAQALADGMQEMMERRREFSTERIRADFEQRFSDKVVAQQLRSLYQQVIDPPTAP